ncbi:Uncharacterized protein HZ326_16018 [Fusarium oxysporum f. sp. albedinis]|nr:Uncharacterized protein HZ326_16018 [Fusarium oxysporum f. sp. albedinis]
MRLLLTHPDKELVLATTYMKEPISLSTVTAYERRGLKLLTRSPGLALLDLLVFKSILQSYFRSLVTYSRHKITIHQLMILLAGAEIPLPVDHLNCVRGALDARYTSSAPTPSQI